MDDTKEYIAELYEKLISGCSKEKYVQLLTLIIDIKREYPEISDSKNSLYLDIKKFIYEYLHNKRRKDYGYEEYDYNIIKGYIYCSGFNEEQKLKLLIYTRYILSSLSYENEWIESHIKKVRLKIAFKKHKLKWLLILSSWNSITLLASILILFGVECVLLLPAPFEWMEVCTITPVHYTDCSFFNHVLNVISLHFDCIENSAKVKFSSWGIVGLLFWSFLYIMVCVNFLFKNLFSNFEVNDKN